MRVCLGIHMAERVCRCFGRTPALTATTASGRTGGICARVGLSWRIPLLILPVVTVEQPTHLFHVVFRRSPQRGRFMLRYRRSGMIEPIGKMLRHLLNVVRWRTV